MLTGGLLRSVADMLLPKPLSAISLGTRVDKCDGIAVAQGVGFRFFIFSSFLTSLRCRGLRRFDENSVVFDFKDSFRVQRLK